MALAMQPFDVYSRLPTFEAAMADFEGIPEGRRVDLLLRFRGIVERHGLSDAIGIDVKHVHFEFPPSTVLVERQDPTKQRAVMKPELIGPGLTPFAFALIDGAWQPYEFVADCPLAERRLVEVMVKTDFMDELRAALEEEGDVARFLGFHVLHRDFLEELVDGTVETPGDAPDELLLRACTPEVRKEALRDGGETKQVMWSWSASRGPRKHLCGICHHSSTCTGHCRSHK